MNDLIEALQIFSKYLSNKNSRWPILCDHDMLYICDVDESVSEEDTKRLNQLGFSWDEDGWTSTRFGSA